MSEADPAASDLDSPEKIARFVDAFYARVLVDERLAPIFLDVARIDLELHLPHIRAYWEKLLLGGADYQRHTMNIHRALHAKQRLEPADFERWLSLFRRTVAASYAGPHAERAVQVAGHIAGNMRAGLMGDKTMVLPIR